jgi:hypothetical protein
LQKKSQCCGKSYEFQIRPQEKRKSWENVAILKTGVFEIGVSERGDGDRQTGWTIIHPALLRDIIFGVPIQISAFHQSVMSNLQEIETAISQLSKDELMAFRDWFAKFDAETWDRQFEEDVTSGRLNGLAERALQHLREGRCTDL